MILCAAFAAGMALNIIPAMAGSKGPCSAWVQAYHAAEKRGDHKAAHVARMQWHHCKMAAAGSQSPEKPTHKRIKERKKSH
jgi:hypothetical protein